jgi:hypothetical protein
VAVTRSRGLVVAGSRGVPLAELLLTGNTPRPRNRETT